MFVNDGCVDDTLNVLKQLRSQDSRVNYIDLSRNFGKDVAMLAGFDYVTGDGMIIDETKNRPNYIVREFNDAKV